MSSDDEGALVRTVAALADAVLLLSQVLEGFKDELQWFNESYGPRYTLCDSRDLDSRKEEVR